MPQRIEVKQVTCPANTPQSAAIETDLTVPPTILVRADIVIPPGHMGLTGLSFAYAHQSVIPQTGSVWVTGNGTTLTFTMPRELTSGAWSAFTYNTDAVYGHTWQIYMLLDDVLPGRREHRRRRLTHADIHRGSEHVERRKHRHEKAHDTHHRKEGER